MDQKEEFQFRPLTQGLGFHNKKSGKIDSGVSAGPKGKPASSTPSTQVSRLISAIPSLDMFDDSKSQKPQLRQPLPRTDLPKATPMVDLPRVGAKPSVSTTQRQSITSQPLKSEADVRKNVASLVGQAAKSAMGLGIPTRSTEISTQSVSRTTQPTPGAPARTPTKTGREDLPEIQLPANKSPFAKPTLDMVETTPELAVELPSLKEIAISIGAMAFDTLLVFGIASLFAVALLLITESDLALVLMNAQEDGATQFGIALVLLTVYELYMVVTRSFFGSTLGDWAFDVTLGNPKQQDSVFYPFKVAWRGFVVGATGFILLPLLSVILKKDVAGMLSGIRTYKTNIR